MSTPSLHLWHCPPGRLLRLAVPTAAAAGLAAAVAAVFVSAAGLLALVPALFLLLLVPVAVRATRQIEWRLHETASLAYLDELTELPNRTFFKQQVECAIAEASAHTAVLQLGLDRFKEINDAFGHRHGDEVLRKVAARLATLEAMGFVVARLGGDEFGILARVDADAAFSIGKRALRALELPFEIEGIPLTVETSIGAAIHPEHGDDAGMLMRRADVAMYTAKDRRSGIAVYEPDADDADRLVLGGELGRALDQEELVLFYQPKISLSSGRIVGVETLVRWRHPIRGLLMPSEFMPFAERTGLVRPLSHYLLERAIRQCSIWQTAAIDIHVAVNLTMHDLVDADLPAKVAALLTGAGLPPEKLELEITESSIMRDPFRARQVLLRLSEMGVRIAIDDFGTGYSSLGYLKRLPVDELKIDRSFVISMATDASDATIVRSTIDLGRNLGLTVVAEGVETAETLERLKDLGCGVAQGYFVGAPAPAELLTELLFAAAPLTRPAKRGPRRLVAKTERRQDVELRGEPASPLKLLR
jgi:diguanylate cyclase (GGDEF)-like protein